MNEQGESAEEYYNPLTEALDSYRKAFDGRGDREAVQALQEALSDVDELRTSTSYWQDDEENGAPQPPIKPPLREIWQEQIPESGDDSRSVFDDVDE